MPRAPRPDRREFPSLPRRPIRLVLDGVTHLPNIGTLFRLCDAFRVERLYVCGFDLALHKRRLTRAASGTLGWVPWEPRATATEIVLESRAAGYSIAAIELCEGSVPPEGIRTEAPLCLVLGAERHGVSKEVLALADQFIEIPTDGMGGSINLTTAAAIVVYQAARRFPLAEGGPPGAGVSD
ncbi:MAG: TrmH family RNA methyltransferase [Polyangiaceae bacterium]|nr:TrmH family RNA methyltransferase [Polyangiaceae bacterium]